MRCSQELRLLIRQPSAATFSRRRRLFITLRRASKKDRKHIALCPPVCRLHILLSLKLSLRVRSLRLGFFGLNVIKGVQAGVIANKRCPNELYIILCSQHLFDNRIHKHNRRIPHREHEFFSKYQAQFLCL